MRSLLAIISIVGSQLIQADPSWVRKYESSGNTAIERWTTLANEADQMPVDQRIDYLSRMLITDEGDVGDHMIEVYKRVQEILISTPGHAEYFGRKIAKTPRNSDRNYWYQYLANMPSPETVRVLGELLADDSERPELADDDSNLEAYMMAMPNSDRAVEALTKLLDNPPPNGFPDYIFSRDLETWRNWYEDVKSGRQTFRFKGDPVHYDLREPSKRSEVLPNTSRSGKRADTSDETGASQSPERQTSRFLLYLLGFLFVAAGLACYFKRRKANA